MKCVSVTKLGTKCTRNASVGDKCKQHSGTMTKSTKADKDNVTVVEPYISINPVINNYVPSNNGYKETITFCDGAENHVGMQKILSNSKIETISYNKILSLKHKYEQEGFKCDLVDLSLDDSYINKCGIDHRAAVLVIRNYIKNDLEVFDEMKGLEWDKQALMRGKVVNKHARHNLVFGDTYQIAKYEEGKGTIIPWSDIPLLSEIKTRLKDEEYGDIVAEGNYYYDVNKCGISKHGDGEREAVIGLRLGATMRLCFAWYQKCNRVSNDVVITLNSGDLYIMSEKAVGQDWRKQIIHTLRHSAGCDKYLFS